MTKARDLSKLLSTATGKIAGANLDVSFENISDTGTVGTKIASGTTGQRGSTAGQIRFNTTTGLAEYYTGSEFKALDAPPTITNINNNSVRQSLLSSNPSVIITGTGFSSSVTAKLVGLDGTEYNTNSTTRDSSTQVTITLPSNLPINNEPYDIKITNNSSGFSSYLLDCLSINDTPTFTTASGSLGILLDGNRLSSNLTSISFTDEESTPTVSVTSGTLPTGITLNSNGTWSGTANAVVSDTTYNFTVTLTDTIESTTRNYSITVKAPIIITYDVVAGGGGNSVGQGNNRESGSGAGGYLLGDFSAVIGTVYTITVGAGGGGRSNGSNSSITGTGLSTILAYGGGSGGNQDGMAGNSGGSGGGGWYNSSGGSGTAGQGNNGGTSYGWTGGGGGGRGSAGRAVDVNNNELYKGFGGDGYQSPINSVTYARGGDGDRYNGHNANESAAANTGNGGGGAGNGGSGIVNLKIPTSYYSGTTSGSPSVSTSGAYTILTFTGSGSYTG